MNAPRLDHVAFALPDRALAPPVLVGELGGEPHGGGPGPGYLCWQWAYARGEKIEVLEPDGPPGGFVHRFLERQGAGVHHVTFKVPDLGAACARAEQAGYGIVGFDDRSPRWKEAFLHPKQAQGIVVQLAQTAEGDDGWGDAFDFPEAPADPPSPVCLEGLRLRARSVERARLQWAQVLGGEACAAPEGTLAFAWAESPLRIFVDVVPDAVEGPVAVEVREPLRALTLSTALGTPFRVV